MTFRDSPSADGALVDRVRKVVARVAGPARVPAQAGPDTPLAEDGFWLDSVDLIELVVACEDEFGVTFEGEADLTPENLRTVRSLAELVLSKGPR